MINTVAIGLARLKREYKNMDLSETQLHEIIPDATRRSSGSGGGDGGETPTE